MMMTKDKTVSVQARIADLNVLMHCKTEFMVRRLSAYTHVFDGEPDVAISVSDEEIEAYVEKYPNIGTDTAEYMLSGAVFYRKLFRKYEGFMLHASGISVDGEGYLFSANSGTGKSTHTNLWKTHFGERAQFINDDKPALRRINDHWYAYGTPWSGKTELNNNICVPIKAIAFIHRSEENTILPMEATQIILALYAQTIRPKTEKAAEEFFGLLEHLIYHVPVYSLGCTMEPAAAEFAYNTMHK